MIFSIFRERFIGGPKDCFMGNQEQWRFEQGTKSDSEDFSGGSVLSRDGFHRTKGCPNLGNDQHVDFERAHFDVKSCVTNIH